MDDCIFCKIVKGSSPCYKIYENQYACAFLDISGDIDGHTLVVPKEHYVNILDCDEHALAEVIKVVQKVARHYVDKCGFDGVNILNANNKEAQQSVFHLHFHIIPRKKDDGEDGFPKFTGAKFDLKTMHEKLKMN